MSHTKEESCCLGYVCCNALFRVCHFNGNSSHANDPHSLFCKSILVFHISMRFNSLRWLFKFKYQIKYIKINILY